MLREIQRLALLLVLAGAVPESFSEEMKDDFAVSVPISEIRNVGNGTPEAAAQTLFWYFNTAQNGADDATLIKTVPAMLLFQTREDLEPWMQSGGYIRQLFRLMITNPDQIVGVQFSRPDSYSRTSDQVVRARINYRDGSSQVKAITFKRTPLADGDRWSARISITKDSIAGFTAAFAPIEQRPIR